MMADQVRGATMPGGNFPDEFNLAAMLCEGKHGCYGFCLWREQVDADGNATLLSCPGWSGFYPWIDRKRGVHGVFLARVADSWNFKWKEFNPMLASASLARLVGEAIDTEAGSLGRKVAKKEVTLGADQKPDAQARAANEDQKEDK
ncbi:MAG: hypothetical protein WCS31_04230 [Verrucomicrobiae bacterium]